MRAPHLVVTVLLFPLGACTGEPRDQVPAPLAPQGAAVIDFERDEAGSLPAGFSVVRIAAGSAGRWDVVETEEALSGGNVLAHTRTEEPSDGYSLAVVGGFFSRDVDVTVKLRPVSGTADEAAGLIWGYTDRDNHYVVHVNAWDDKVVLYKMTDGNRTDLEISGAWPGEGVRAAVPEDAWSELRVIARASLFTVYLDGRKLFQVEDGTPREAAQIGLWTTADCVTWFDDLRFVSLYRLAE